MTAAGFLILAGFFLFAALMIARLLPPLLALPLMAAWVAVVAGLPFPVYLNQVLLQGAMKLANAMAVVIFGAMFARVIMRTGISDTIIKKAAELAGDQPLPIALILTAATAFVFLGMSGLGAVIMVGSITLPIMTSAGIAPLTACGMLLLGLQTGLLANAANYGTYIGIFGGEVTASYYLPAATISAIITLLFILLNVRQEQGQPSLSILRILKGIFHGLAMLLESIFHGLSAPKASLPSRSSLLQKRKRVPAAALLSPMIPLATVYIFKLWIGFGSTEAGMIDPVAASVFGFLLASCYAILLTRPGQFINILAGSIVDGIKDIAGVLFLFMGIGMLVAVVMHPVVSAVLDPVLAAVIPTTPWCFLVFFGLLAPTALYRGPLNMFGMGAGIASLVASLQLLPPEVVAGAFLGIQYVQGASDPTNSHNTWMGGFAGVDTAAILKKTLPYTWGMCLLMLCYVSFVRW